MAQCFKLPYAFQQPTLSGGHYYRNAPRTVASYNVEGKPNYDSSLFNFNPFESFESESTFWSRRPDGIASTTRISSSSGLPPTSFLGAHDPRRLLGYSHPYAPADHMGPYNNTPAYIPFHPMADQSMGGASAFFDSAASDDPSDRSSYLPSGADRNMGGGQISDGIVPAALNPDITHIFANGSQQSQLVERTQRLKSHKQTLAKKELRPPVRRTKLVACLICASERIDHPATMHDGLEGFTEHFQTTHLLNIKTGKSKENGKLPCPCPWPGCRKNSSCADIVRHMQKHANIKLRCTQCTKAMSREDQFRKHVRETNDHDANIVSWDEV